VTSRNLEQWFLRITHYAQELLDATDRLTEWPEKVLTMQRNWIGRSEGARVSFPLMPAGIEPGGPASIPTVPDGSPRIDVFMMENGYRHGPFGAKGLGELPFDGAAPAVANAVRHLGYDVRSLPITPERLSAMTPTVGARRATLANEE
jgi:hypothetical protein